jgi:hypothetical protein
MNGFCNKSNTTDATSREGTAQPSVALAFIPVFCGAIVAQSSVVRVFFFVDHCLSFLYLCHCMVCPLIYGFGLPIWYLQTCRLGRSCAARSQCDQNIRKQDRT